jgi:hypothetical protein
MHARLNTKKENSLGSNEFSLYPNSYSSKKQDDGINC